MLLSPRYSGPPIITMDGSADDVHAPLVNQRRRLESILSSLTADQWETRSRCSAWTVKDVVAHLAGINPMFVMSALAGLDGKPTRLMRHFDPAKSPPMMVDQLGALSPDEVLNLFVTSNDALFTVLDALDEKGWSTTAESVPGDVSMRLLMSHALWDSWVHERDIVLPLGIEPVVVAEEVTASLRYVAALSPAFAIGAEQEYSGEFAIETTAPAYSCVVEVKGSVAVRTGATSTEASMLKGSAVELTEALSTRLPLPDDSPAEWHKLLQGLKYTWDLTTECEVTA